MLNINAPVSLVDWCGHAILKNDLSEALRWLRSVESAYEDYKWKAELWKSSTDALVKARKEVVELKGENDRLTFKLHCLQTKKDDVSKVNTSQLDLV